MAKMMNVPIIGIVENMSYVECPDCKKKYNIFGESKIDEVAKAARRSGARTSADRPQNRFACG